MKTFIIAVLSADGFIAKNSGHLADWTSKDDKKFFVEMTKKAGVVIMGQNTFETIGRPLPNRLNIVYSRDKEYEGVEITQKDPKELLSDLKKRGYQDQKSFIQKIKDDDAFAKEWGDILTVYGRMWRKWPGKDHTIDQIDWVIEKLKKSPDRRHAVVSAWNPDFIYEMASQEHARPVPPFCHTMFHFNVLDGKLSCLLYQRSADMFLGVPFNIASYALLTLMIAQVTGYPPGEFIHTFGDAHIYSNHYEQVKEQLTREPRPFPIMKLNPDKKNIDDFVFDDFTLENYNPHPVLKGEITVVGGF